jgi:bacillithiol biosynthesis deacetylase BshB1
MKLDILAFGAHPDDVELSCGGTIIRSVREGKKVGIVDLTRGELATRGDIETRKKEAEAASKILGLSVRENLGFDVSAQPNGFADGFILNDQKHQLEVVRMIRKYQPEIILCNAVEDRHPDHGKASKLVSDSCFLAGLLKLQTTDNGSTQTPWRVKAVYHYIQDHQLKPDVVIDVTDVMELKMKAIMCFKSQFFDEASHEPVTPISTKEFQEYLYAKATAFGRSIGVRYAEGFTVERTPGVKSLFDLL